VSEGLSWFVDGRNLGDRAYVATTGVVADTRVPFNPANPAAVRPPRDGAYYLPGDGRSVYVGLEWRL
jgi:iron complex outermembrane receptor protein